MNAILLENETPTVDSDFGGLSSQIQEKKKKNDGGGGSLSYQTNQSNKPTSVKSPRTMQPNGNKSINFSSGIISPIGSNFQ